MGRMCWEAPGRVGRMRWEAPGRVGRVRWEALGRVGRVRRERCTPSYLDAQRCPQIFDNKSPWKFAFHRD